VQVCQFAPDLCDVALTATDQGRVQLLVRFGDLTVEAIENYLSCLLHGFSAPLSGLNFSAPTVGPADTCTIPSRPDLQT
jgi:hypothetical protein